MVSEFLEQVAVWCTDARSIDEEVLQVPTTSDHPAILSYSVDRLWFQQRVDVPDPTTDAAEAVMWMFDEAAPLADLVARQLAPS